MQTRNNLGIFIYILVFGFCIFSCQSINRNPVLPIGQAADLTSIQTSYNSTTNHAFMWGYWHIAIDPSTSDVDIIPLRGVQFSANVNTFLEPGGHQGQNLAISLDPADSDIPGNLLAVDVILGHPFPDEMYSGFDVRGILIHNGSVHAKSDPGIVFGVEGNNDDAILLNADGWTRWWNPAEFTTPGILGYTQGALAAFDNISSATLNAYKAFADDLEPEQDYREFIIDEINYQNRGWFSAGSTNTRRYLIQFPIGQLPEYDYCVYAGWEETSPANSGNPDLYEPDDFPLSANTQEAFLLACDTSGSTAYYAGPGDSGGIINLQLEIFDWQGILGDGINNEISEIRIESLGDLINEPDNTFIIDNATAALLSDEGSDISSVYDIDITTLNLTQTGDEDLLISVLNLEPDSYNSGFGADYPEGSPLAAYLFTTVTITGESSPSCTFTYSPQAYGTAYECSPGAYVIQTSDLTPTGTYKVWDEGVTDPINIGFIFSYGGTDYTSIIINVNGSITFGYESEEAAVKGLACSEIPTHDIISPIDDDLDNETGSGPIGEIKYETRIIGADTCFIAEWEGVPSWQYPPSSTSTFQIVLIDGSDTSCDNIIFQWYELNVPDNDTVMQYDLVTYCIFSGGGQTVPGAILIYPQ